MTSHQIDYYELLGVRPTASSTDLHRAYRRAARATHPDIHPNDTLAAERFRAITTAYETLNNSELRASYDRTHRSFGATAVRVVARPPLSDAPIHLGRASQRPAAVQPRHARPTLPLADQRADLAEIFARLLSRSALFPYGDYPGVV